jgi:hypothetical protein
MRFTSTLRLAVLAAALLVDAFQSAAQTARGPQSLDAGWRFFQGDASGAEQPRFKDAQWKPVDVPFDWSVAGPFAQTNPAGEGFLPVGVSWYRKRFTLPVEDLDRCMFVKCDGVMGAGDVWINGRHLGHQPDGCAGFQYEMPASALSFGGATNVLTVCADTPARPASRGYTGAGICRHVWLLALSPVHFAPHGIFVSTPRVSSAEARVHIETTVTNESREPRQITLQTTLLSPEGEPAGFIESSEDLAAESTATLEQDMVLPQPQWWNLTSPALYQVRSKLNAEAQGADEQTTAFGIRSAHFDADTGFWLNGANLTIKGVCLHEDGGAFGAAAPLSIWHDRLKTLKSLGVNAVRTARHPPTPEFLDLCNRMGLLVMDDSLDGWTATTNGGGLDRYLDGQFPWTGVDYLGESGGWPAIGPGAGLLDRTGAARPIARRRQSEWSDVPMVAMARRGPETDREARPDQELFSDWTPVNLKPHIENVEVYSNCRKVQLFLNGRSLGSKAINPDGSPRTWRVPFAPGVLKAVARNSGRWPVATAELLTAGRPAAIILSTGTTVLSPDWDAVAIVRARIVDASGVTVPRADDEVHFTVSGPGTIATVDNGDNASHESFQGSSRTAWRGICAAFLRANAPAGKITVTATAAGLRKGSVTIQATGE